MRAKGTSSLLGWRGDILLVFMFIFNHWHYCVLKTSQLLEKCIKVLSYTTHGLHKRFGSNSVKDGGATETCGLLLKSTVFLVKDWKLKLIVRILSNKVTDGDQTVPRGIEIAVIWGQGKEEQVRNVLCRCRTVHVYEKNMYWNWSLLVCTKTLFAGISGADTIMVLCTNYRLFFVLLSFFAYFLQTREKLSISWK